MKFAQYIATKLEACRPMGVIGYSVFIVNCAHGAECQSFRALK